MRRNVLRIVAIAAAATLALAWFTVLRPVGLGGPSTYVTIRGTSMLPTYEPGDLVLTRRDSSYATGDIVAYRVPRSDTGEGIVVIHRVIGGSRSEGYVLQGDNNPERDFWYPRNGDVVGKAWVRIPKAGLVLTMLRSPLPLAGLMAALAVTLVVFPKKRRSGQPGLTWATADDLRLGSPRAAIASMVFGGAVGQAHRMPVAVARRS